MPDHDRADRTALWAAGSVLLTLAAGFIAVVACVLAWAYRTLPS